MFQGDGAGRGGEKGQESLSTVNERTCFAKPMLVKQGFMPKQTSFAVADHQMDLLILDLAITGYKKRPFYPLTNPIYICQEVLNTSRPDVHADTHMSRLIIYRKAL